MADLVGVGNAKTAPGRGEGGLNPLIFMQRETRDPLQAEAEGPGSPCHQIREPREVSARDTWFRRHASRQMRSSRSWICGSGRRARACREASKPSTKTVRASRAELE